MKYISTRGQAPKINFSDTLITGLASDGGLYLPENYPYVTGSGMHNMNPYSFVPNNVPVIKNYHISMPNPAGDHVKLADIYEDMLPNDNTKYKKTRL